MTAQLPPNLLKLFAPRPPLPYARPVGKSPNTIRPKTVNGVAALLAQIRDDTAFSIAERGKSARKTKREAAAKKEGENGDAVMANGDTKEEGEEDDDDVKVEVPLEDPTKEPGFSYAEETRRQIAREEKARRRKEAFENAKTTYTPNDNKKARGDPYKTLFISRLSKKATEADVRKEFEIYGNIEYLTIVKDEKGRSRGYCFIVYEREKDMKAAYKDAEGLVILGKKILVDVERGRTVRGWKPRRLGGGLGGRPKPVAPVEAAPAFGGSSFGGRGGGGGGFRGGGRGGFSDRGGGGFRGRGGGFGDRGGFGGGDRGGGGGFRGGFSDRGGPPGGGFGGGDRGYGDRGGFRGGPPGGYGSDRGGFGGGGAPAAGGFSSGGGGDRGGFGGPPGGGYGRGRGIGFQGGFNSSGPPPGYGAPVSGGDRGGYSGGGGMKRDYDGGEDRDQKRVRY